MIRALGLISHSKVTVEVLEELKSDFFPLSVKTVSGGPYLKKMPVEGEENYVRYSLKGTTYASLENRK